MSDASSGSRRVALIASVAVLVLVGAAVVAALGGPTEDDGAAIVDSTEVSSSTTVEVTTTPSSTSSIPSTTTGAATSNCTTAVGADDDLSEAVVTADDGDIICLEDGDYGVLSIDGEEMERSEHVTVVSNRPFGAVFDAIELSSASFLRFESLTVLGQIRNGDDDTHDIEIVGNDINGIIIDAPTIASSDTRPHSWLIEHNDIGECSSFCIALLSADPDKYQPIVDVVIRGNRIGPMAEGEDAIRIHNWRNLRIEDNEIFGVIENGQHNDCLQSVWGGSGMVFARNYIHDNNCQVFFLKDGYVSDVEFTDNLSLRNRVESASVSAKVYPTGGLTMTNNTLWDASPFYLRSRPHGGKFPTGDVRDYVITNNVLGEFIPFDDDQSEGNKAGLFKDPDILMEDYNVFGGGWTWVPDLMGPHSVEDPQPDFVAPSEDQAEDLALGDWRLAGDVSGGGTTYAAGITWQLSGRLFGTAARP